MKTFAALVFSLCVSGFVSAASIDEETNQYVQVLADGKSFDAASLEALAWKGISDTRLFDLIERRVLDTSPDGYASKNVRADVGLYMRALGFSGQPKYRDTLMQFSGDKAYEKFAKNALENLPNYQKWNPIISNRTTFDAKYSDDVNRFLNMLRSDDFELKKLAAIRIYYKNKDEVLLDTLADQIRASYMSTDNKKSDAIAWMIKALGSAKQPKYRPLLEEVAFNAKDRTILRHATKALES